MIKPSADIYTRFFTYNSSGVLTDDDGTPAGVLVKNGTDTVETVTVTKLATGSYKAEFTIPSDAVTGDVFELQITVTMSTVVQKDIIWRDIVDTYTNSDVVTELRNTSGFEKIVPKTMLIPTADSNIYLLAAIADSPDNSEIGISLLNGNNAILYEDDALTTPLSASVTFENYMVMPSLNANIYSCYVKVDHTETAKQYNYIFVYTKNSVEYYHTAETSLIDEDVVVKSLSTDVITADSIKTDAITEIQNGLATGVDLATVDGIVDAIKLKTDGLNFTGTDVKATLDSEKVAVSSLDNDVITAAAIKTDAITELQSGLATSLEISTVEGKVDDISLTIGEAGVGLTALGDTRLANLDAAISTRMATFSYTEPDNASITAIKTVTDKLDDTLELDTDVYKFTANALEEAPTGEGGGGFTETDRTNLGNIKTVTDKINFNVNDDVIATLDGETVAVSSIGNNVITAASINSDAVTELQAGLATSVDLGTVDTVVDAIKAKTDNLPADPASNTQVNTRMASFTYTAPDNASIGSIKAKTDQLTFSSGDVVATLNGETVTTSSVTDKTGYALTAAYDAAKTAATQTSVNTVDGVVDAIKAKTDALPADPASNTVVNTRLATVGYTAPDNASITAIKAKTDNLPSDPATETSLSGIEDKIDTLQSSVETGNNDTPTVEEIVEGILTGAIDGNIDLQTATKKILSVISNNMYATVDSTDILYEYKNSDNTETVVTFRVAEDGTSRESE